METALIYFEIASFFALSSAIDRFNQRVVVLCGSFHCGK